jgi:excisionase family DNA binding protein
MTEHLPGTYPNGTAGTSPAGTSHAVGMSIEEAAQHLGCSINTVRRAIKAGRLTAHRERRPQGYAYRVFLPTEDVPSGTFRHVPTETPAQQLPTQVPTEVPAQWLAPIAHELAAARQQIADQAERIGHLTAELEAARVQLAQVQAPASVVVAPECTVAPAVQAPPRPWWAFWWR